MSLKKYIVGGWVRDKLLSELGHPMQSNDKDWVVTGRDAQIKVCSGRQ